MKVKQAAILLVIVLILVSGCSLQKRTYRKGYYVHWNSSLNKKDKISSHKDKKVEIAKTETTEEEPLFASNNKDFIPIIKRIWDSIKTTSCGDSLWSANGTVSLVKIMEVNDKEIKYKRCSNLSGPLIVVPRSYVSKIKYFNGVTENYATENKPEVKTEKVQPSSGKGNTQNQNSDPQIRPGKPASDFYAKLALIMAGILVVLIAAAVATGFYFPVASFFLALASIAALILTFVFSGSALRKIRKNPEEHKGKGMASGALAIAIIASIAIVLLLILLLVIIFLALLGI